MPSVSHSAHHLKGLQVHDWLNDATIGYDCRVCLVVEKYDHVRMATSL